MNSIIPGIGPTPPLRLPDTIDRRLSSGLRLVTANYPSIPIVEFRLAIPLSAGTYEAGAAHEILAVTLSNGTTERSGDDLALDLAAAGATLSITRSTQWLVLSGSTPTAAFTSTLDIVSEILVGAAHSEPAVGAARGRIRHRITAARCLPQLIAAEALLKHRYGLLPELADVPPDDAMDDLSSADIKRAHDNSVRPDHAVMVVVGDIDPADAQAEVAERLQAWRPLAAPSPRRHIPTADHSGIAWIDRTGATQSLIRLARPAVDRSDPCYSALTLANIVFGGYFSSRLVMELRERQGLAYQCEARFQDHLDQVVIMIEVDTAVESAQRTLDAVHGQLRTMTDNPPLSAEIVAARRYLAGMTMMSVASQRSWADSLILGLTLGQAPDHMRVLLENLHDVSDDDVRAVAAHFYRPEDFEGIVLGGNR